MKSTSRRASSALVGCFLLLGGWVVSSEAVGRCIGSTEDRYSRGCGGKSEEQRELEAGLQQIEINGRKLSDITRFYDLVGMRMSAAYSAAPELASIAKDIAGTIAPILPKCAVATKENPIKTPDQDGLNGWILARSSVIQTYAGNWDIMRLGLRVDVLYPSGDIVRFITGSPLTTASGGRDIRLSRFIDGIATQGTSPCK